jgi:hypothetical protein
MNREVVTDPLDGADLWQDLGETIRLTRQLGLSDLRLFFGYAWGKQIYDDRWVEIATAPGQVEARIADAQRRRYGRLGDDNVYIRLPEIDVRVEYSYEATIHLSYGQENAFVKSTLRRWESLQWMLGPKIRS